MTMNTGIELPIVIINNIFRMVAEMDGQMWYYHVFEDGKVRWKYLIKNKRVASMDFFLQQHKNVYYPLFQQVVLCESKRGKRSEFSDLFIGHSVIVGKTKNNQLIVYKTLENNNEKVYILLYYHLDGYTQGCNKLDRGMVYRREIAYEVIDFHTFHSQLNNQGKVSTCHYYQPKIYRSNRIVW